MAQNTKFTPLFDLTGIPRPLLRVVWSLFAWSLLLLSAPVVSAQSPYTIKTGRELAWAGGGAVLFGTGKWLEHSVKPFNEAQILALNTNRVPRFDQYALRQYSLRAKRGSDLLLYATPVLPLLLAFDSDVRKRTPAYAVLTGESVLLSLGLTTLAKNTVRRTRPFVYNTAAPLHLKMERDARESFFSGHTSTTAAFAFSTAKIWSDHHVGSRWQPWVWVGAAAVPLTTGILRIRAGKHFPSDVLAGMAVGALCGWLVPELHR